MSATRSTVLALTIGAAAAASAESGALQQETRITQPVFDGRQQHFFPHAVAHDFSIGAAAPGRPGTPNSATRRSTDRKRRLIRSRAR